MHAGSSFNNLSLLWLFSWVDRTEGISGHKIYLCMGVSYSYCIVCWFDVLIAFHSDPAFPEPDSWAVNGDYSGVQDLSFRTSARSPPPAGFATLSVFQSIQAKVFCGNTCTCGKWTFN